MRHMHLFGIYRAFCSRLESPTPWAAHRRWNDNVPDIRWKICKTSSFHRVKHKKCSLLLYIHRGANRLYCLKISWQKPDLLIIGMSLLPGKSTHPHYRLYLCHKRFFSLSSWVSGLPTRLLIIVCEWYKTLCTAEDGKGRWIWYTLTSQNRKARPVELRWFWYPSFRYS